MRENPCAVFAGLAGVLGTMAGSAMPWVDAGRVAPFDLLPYVVSFAAIVLPNLLIFCAISFTAAVLTRSQHWTFAVVLSLVVLEVVLVNVNMQGGPPWLALIDPTGALSITATTRYWTVADLNTRLPVTMTLVANRGIWLVIALSALAFSLIRVRMERPLARQLLMGFRRTASSATTPALSAIECSGRFRLSRFPRSSRRRTSDLAASS